MILIDRTSIVNRFDLCCRFERIMNGAFHSLKNEAFRFWLAFDTKTTRNKYQHNGIVINAFLYYQTHQLSAQNRLFLLINFVSHNNHNAYTIFVWIQNKRLALVATWAIFFPFLMTFSASFQLINTKQFKSFFDVCIIYVFIWTLTHKQMKKYKPKNKENKNEMSSIWHLISEWLPLLFTHKYCLAQLQPRPWQPNENRLCLWKFVLLMYCSYVLVSRCSEVRPSH